MAIPWGAILQAAPAVIGGLSSIFGARGNAQAREEQGLQRKAMEQRNRAFYDRDYYGDYTRRADVQAGLQNMRDILKLQNQRDRNREVITGATNEASSKVRESQNKAIGNFMRDAASRGELFKERATGRYLQGQGQIDQMNYADLARKAHSSNNLMYNGLKGLAETDWAGIVKAFKK